METNDVRDEKNNVHQIPPALYHPFLKLVFNNIQAAAHTWRQTTYLMRIITSIRFTEILKIPHIYLIKAYSAHVEINDVMSK